MEPTIRIELFLDGKTNTEIFYDTPADCQDCMDALTALTPAIEILKAELSAHMATRKAPPSFVLDAETHPARRSHDLSPLPLREVI